MIRKKSVSIKDIAKVANVSYSTVSRALRDNNLVNPQTRARILHWAKKLSYSTNAIARGLATQQTHMVGLVVTTIADPFLGEVVDGIEKRALKQDFSVLQTLAQVVYFTKGSAEVDSTTRSRKEQAMGKGL